MRLLLDENFPLALYRRLRRLGADVEHLITSEKRGVPDSAIVERLRNEHDLLFLTQDADFIDQPGLAARVIVSRVRQSRKIGERVVLWTGVLESFLADAPAGRMFELFDDGTLLPWEVFDAGQE